MILSNIEWYDEHSAFDKLRQITIDSGEFKFKYTEDSVDFLLILFDRVRDIYAKEGWYELYPLDKFMLHKVVNDLAYEISEYYEVED